MEPVEEAVPFPVAEADAMAALIEGVRQDMMLAMMGELHVLAASCAEVCVQRLLELRVEVSSAVEEEVREHCSGVPQAASLKEAVRQRTSFLDLFQQPNVVRELAIDESEIGPGESDDDGASSLAETYERLDKAASGRLTVCQRPGCNEIAPHNCCALLCRRHCISSRCSAHSKGPDSQTPLRARTRRVNTKVPLIAEVAPAASIAKDKVPARKGETPATPVRWSRLNKEEELSGNSEDSTALSEPAPEAPCKIEEEPEEAADGERLVIEAGDVLEVIGGTNTGGILVRKGRAVSSSLETERLSPGAIIRVQQHDRGRLKYELMQGSGPSIGWVSSECKGHPLLRHVSETEEEAEDDPAMDEPPLSVAVRDGDEDLVLKLLQKGANPNELDAMGEPPIFEAVMNHAHNLVAMLLVAGADPTHCTPLGVTAETLTDGDIISEELLQYPQVNLESSSAQYIQHAAQALDASAN